MSLALSSADEDVINRTVAVSADSTEILSDAILKDIYAVEKCVEWVVRNDFKRVSAGLLCVHLDVALPVIVSRVHFYRLLSSFRMIYWAIPCRFTAPLRS